MSSSKTAPDLPKNIDRYQVRALLGGGTFGTVYRAFDPRLDREIALKVLRPEMTTSIQAVERFLREAKAAAKLFHPHIVANTWRDPGFALYNQTDNDPVVEVTWNDAVKSSQWLSKKEKRTYELPTVAEWEHACRAGTTDFSFGDNPKTLDDYAWYGKTFGHTHPVGEKKPNSWGLFDMHGNVRQWCADSYDVAYYNNSRDKYPENTVKSGARVLRGGSYDDASGHCRSASRYWNAPADPLINLGFRVRVRLD